MTPERQQEFSALFARAVGLPSGEQVQLLQHLQTADPEMFQDLLAKLRAGRGLHFGPYQVLAELGHGGLGVVYLAARADDQYSKKVAVKVVQAALSTPELVERFRHERQILANLDHPHIVRLLDGGATEQGLPYFVMDYVEGLPLTSYVAGRNLPVPRRLELFLKVCLVVQYVHQNLVIHRDLKPGNILVSSQGEPKILDFGIAKILGPDPGAPSATLPGERILTVEYASPEQVRGEPLTTASDIYSLGMILYELLTGAPAFRPKDTSPASVIRAICEDDPPMPATLRGDLDNILRKALAKDPARRYSSAAHFADDIRRYLGGFPVQARPDRWSYRAGKFLRRHPGGIAAAALVVLSLAAGVVATARQARIAQVQRDRAEQRFQQVRGIAHSFLLEVDPLIQDLPGSTPARQFLVRRALQYLGDLAKDPAADRALRLELVQAYLKVGDVQGNPYGPNLGDTAGALSSYRQAAAIGEECVRRQPADAEAVRFLAQAHRSLGEVMPLVGDPAGAVPEFRRAIALLEPLPRDPGVSKDLSSCYETLGDVLGRSGIPSLHDTAAARDAYDKALALAQAKRTVAVVRMKLGDLALDAGDAAAALSAYRASALIFEELRGAQPSNAAATRAVGMIRRKIGVALADTGQSVEALAEYEAAAQIQRQLAAADPANTQARMDLSIVLKNRADLYEELKRPGDAMAAYREMLQIIEPMAAAGPESHLLQTRRAQVLLSLGKLLHSTGVRGEGRRIYGQGLEILRRMAEAKDAAPLAWGHFADALLNAPETTKEQTAEAVRFAQRGVDATKGADPALTRLLERARQALTP